jgi:uncharacterized protein YndB with AHSA1/START domain
MSQSQPTSTVPNVIERSIDIAAPVSKVWAAIADHKAFGSWFGVVLDQPFAPGQPSTGFITSPGYEHLRWTATVAEVVPERLLSFYWHPYAIDPAVDYSGEQSTLVEFHLEPVATGTRLTVIESGFDHVPEARRATAYLMNSKGWEIQLSRVKSYAE